MGEGNGKKYTTVKGRAKTVHALYGALPVTNRTQSNSPIYMRVGTRRTNSQPYEFAQGLALAANS